MTQNPEQFQRILEAAIMAAGRPLTVGDLQKLFDEAEQPSAKDVRLALTMVQERYQNNGIELVEVASGFQFQARVEYSQWLSRLWEERPPRYSRALLETLALIAYRQPITRAEIEEIRGVAVSSQIIKTLQEREWIRVIGHRDVPGKPALYATTKSFLDHLNLKSLDELPALSDLKDLESQEEKLQVELELTPALEEVPAMKEAAEALVETQDDEVEIITSETEIEIELNEEESQSEEPQNELSE